MVDVPSRGPDSTGAGAPEDTSTVITPEMMRAGISAWARGDDEFDSHEEIVGRIFREMMMARKQVCTA